MVWFRHIKELVKGFRKLDKVDTLGHRDLVHTNAEKNLIQNTLLRPQDLEEHHRKVHAVI